MPSSATRPATAVGLIACLLVMGCVGSGHAQALPPAAAAAASLPFLFSVDVLLDEADAPVLLGIRDGQTVAQVCVCCVAVVGGRVYLSRCGVRYSSALLSNMVNHMFR